MSEIFIGNSLYDFSLILISLLISISLLIIKYFIEKRK